MFPRLLGALQRRLDIRNADEEDGMARIARSASDATAELGAQVLRCHHDQGLEFVDYLGTTDKNRMPRRRYGPDRFPESSRRGVA